MTTSETGRRWVENLREGGYEGPVVDAAALRALARGTRVWRRLFRLLRVKPGSAFFELGCGGGTHLAILGFAGHRVTGIDVSPEVLTRCREYLGRVEQAAERKLPVEMILGDFVSFDSQDRYDVVFNFGVIEHFLDERERLDVLRRMFALTKPGGYVLSVVPSGMHALRSQQRRTGLGGYNVPEIDYDDALALSELRAVGAVDARVYPHALFTYKLWAASPSRVGRMLDRTTWALGQMVPLVRAPVLYQHAGSLLIIGQRPK